MAEHRTVECVAENARPVVVGREVLVSVGDEPLDADELQAAVSYRGREVRGVRSARALAELAGTSMEPGRGDAARSSAIWAQSIAAAASARSAALRDKQRPRLLD